MAIPLQCSCGKRLTAPDSAAGRRVRCPSCKSVINVPPPNNGGENVASFPTTPSSAANGVTGPVSLPSVTSNTFAAVSAPVSLPIVTSNAFAGVTGTAFAPPPQRYHASDSIAHHAEDSTLIRIIRETAANSGYRITSFGPSEIILEKGSLLLSIVIGAIAPYIYFRVRVTPSPPDSYHISLERNTPWWTGLLGVLSCRSQFQTLTTAVASAVHFHGGQVVQHATHGRIAGLTVSSIGTSPAGGDRACPSCAETLKPEARVCRFCGHQFSDQDIENARRAAIAQGEQRNARFESLRRQAESEKARRKATVCLIFGSLLAGIWALFVFVSLAAFLSGPAGNGPSMTIADLFFGLACFTIPLGLPGFLLLYNSRKHKAESQMFLMPPSKRSISFE